MFGNEFINCNYNCNYFTDLGKSAALNKHLCTTHEIDRLKLAVLLNSLIFQSWAITGGP